MFMERVQKIVWVPPNYCNAVACSYAGGTLSLWEEIVVSTLELGIVVHRSSTKCSVPEECRPIRGELQQLMRSLDKYKRRLLDKSWTK
ncbi:hypothetical protein RHGRI_029821 [Rhododendron griersonianum]|uniref:Uncharacterized protein n=1 Tax=Rhododendron griersonianum TaxID=479676 RepID=A0AAV6IRR1_9ERIC|nr:hypothetical protein RHGRI_029821 [Rhododendron griersonianum]